MVFESEAPRDKLADRIADAEERLRRSISQRIERNRMELARLQQEQELFDRTTALPKYDSLHGAFEGPQPVGYDNGSSGNSAVSSHNKSPVESEGDCSVAVIPGLNHGRTALLPSYADGLQSPVWLTDGSGPCAASYSCGWQAFLTTCRPPLVACRTGTVRAQPVLHAKSRQ